MTNRIIIEWNTFIEMCCKNYPEESCAYLFAKTPFRMIEEWFVFPVENLATDKTKQWASNLDDLKKVKKEAKKQGLTKIGNIHSHPLLKEFKTSHLLIKGLMIENNKYPSVFDLEQAREVNDIVTGILVVDNENVYAYCFYDQFGVQLPDLHLNGVNIKKILQEAESILNSL